MTLFEENLSPYLTLVESATPGSPAAGNRRLVVGTDHVLRWIDSAGLVSPLVALNKWDATTAPTANEDSGDGYAVGSVWIDTTNDKVYVCTDASLGAAVWKETSNGTAMTNPMTTTGDIIYSSDNSGTPARLAAGTVNYVLTAQGAGAAPVWAAAGAGVTLASLSPAADTHIDSQNATTNYETNTDLTIGSDMSTASFTRVGLMEFDLSSLSGKTILQAVLWMTRTDTSNGLDSDANRILACRKVLQAAVLTQATWNVYATASNWATAGARTLGTDLTTAEYGRANLAYLPNGTRFGIDVTDFAIDRIGQAAAQMALGLRASGASGLNAFTVAAQNNATSANRPVLKVAYTG